MKHRTKTRNVYRPVTISRNRAPSAWKDGRMKAGTNRVHYGASAVGVGSILWITEDNCGDSPRPFMLTGEMQNALG